MKYIRSFFDDKKSIIKIDGCQYCPLLKFNLSGSICICRNFIDGNGSDIIEPWVLNHTLSGLILDKIRIPKWCKLPNTLNELRENRITYRPFVSSILINDNDDCNNDLLPFIDMDETSLKNPEKVYDYLMSLVDRDNTIDFFQSRFRSINNRNNINNTDYDEEYYNRNYDESYYKPKHGVCSCCGEEDETVKRDKNYGMCDDCWNLYNEDEEKKKQSFINNFRMKRNNDFDYNKTFKIINELKIT